MEVKLYAELETYPDPFSDQMDGHINWYKKPGENRVEIVLTEEDVFEETLESGSWTDFCDENGIMSDDHQQEIDKAQEMGLIVDGVLEAVKEDDSTEFCCDVYRMMLRRKFGDV